MRHSKRTSRSTLRASDTLRGFTLIEVMIAGVITAFVMSSITMSLAQLGRAKTSSRMRFEAHLRADAALTTLRRDIAAVMRSGDLFLTRLVIFEDQSNTPLGELRRDELLLFNTKLRPIRNIDYNGEGLEYESQYRIDFDDSGPVLWHRRDALPDEFPMGGGVAVPTVEGVISVAYEAYDGEQWFSDWDSDDDGLPLAIRVTVTASGHRGADDIYTAPIATLRTVVSIDRVTVPDDLIEEEEAIDQEEADAINDAESAAAAEEASAGGGSGLSQEGLDALDAAGGVPGGTDINRDTGGRGGGDSGGGRTGDTPTKPTESRSLGGGSGSGRGGDS